MRPPPAHCTSANPLRPRSQWVAVCHRCPHPSPPFHPVRLPLFLSVSATSEPGVRGRTARRGGRGAAGPSARGAPRGGEGARAGGAPGRGVRRRGWRPPRLGACAAAPPARWAPGMHGGGGDGDDASSPASSPAACRAGVRAARWRRGCAAATGQVRGCRSLEEATPREQGGSGPGGRWISEERAALVQAGPPCTCGPGTVREAAIWPLPGRLPGPTGP